MDTGVSSYSKPRRVFIGAKAMLAGAGFFGALVMALVVGSDYSQADSAGVSGKGAEPQIAPLSRVAQAGGEQFEHSDQLTAKIAELDAILAEKQRLEDALRVEKSAQSAAALQSSNAKKLIRMELEDFFAQSSNRERLDTLLADYKRSADEEQAALQRVQSVEKDLSAKQLSFSQAARDVERLKAQLASEVRKRNSKKIQSIARRLDKTLYFNESVSFRCSTTKSLAACLAGYEHDGRMSQWVLDHYERVLGEDIRDQVEELKLSPSWYGYRTKTEFSEASMSMDGTVTAQMSIQANVTAKKMMACAILDVPYEMCDSKTHSLIVRSNRYNDQVLINEQPQGSTPISLMLDSGVYEVQVTSGGVTQKRTLSLKGDQVVNFKF
ncbi:PEGA domain-containing protein [Stutzerimonas sp. NM35]